MKLKRRFMIIFIAASLILILTGLGWICVYHPDTAFQLGVPQDVLIWSKERQLQAWDARLEKAQSRSDNEAVAILRTMLGGNLRERTYAIQWLLRHEVPPESAAAATKELVDLLETKYGGEVDISSVVQLLMQMGPHVKGELPRLLQLASSGDPIWRRLHALSILASMRSDSADVLAALTQAAGDDADETLVRARAQQLLQSQRPVAKALAGKALLASKYADARVTALKLLEASATDTAVDDARQATQDSSGVVRCAALLMLCRIAPTESLEIAKSLLQDGDVLVQAAAIGALLKASQPLPDGAVEKVLSELRRGFDTKFFSPDERLRFLYAAAEVDSQTAVAWAKTAIESTRKDVLFTDHHRKLLQEFVEAREESR